jgi:uncharacterized protein YecE (DUF72 family)
VQEVTSGCLGEFLGRLGSFLGRVEGKERLVVEIRNPKWIGEELLGLLREHKVSFALTDQEWMPRPAALWKQWGPKLLTGGVAYVRFLGQRKRIDAMTETWDKIVIDRAPEMAETIGIFREFLDQRIPTWAYFNNHYAGHAPASIELLKELWNRSG